VPVEELRAKGEAGGLALSTEPVLAGPAWTLANIFSISRLVLCLPIALALLRDTKAGDWVALSLMGWAALSDMVDGPIARRTGSRSRLGAALDPIADKILIGSILVTLVLVKSFPIWVAAVIILRDVCILIAAAWLFRKKGVLLESTSIGKMTGIIFALMIGSYTLNLHPISLLLAYLGVLFALLSSILYSARLFRLV